MPSNELFPLASERSEPINVELLISKYLRFWYLFLLGAVLALVLAYGYLRYYATPQYYINSSVLIKDEKSGGMEPATNGFSGLEMFNATKNIDNEIEILKSKTLMERVVKALDLSTSYQVEGRIHDIEIYGKSLPIKIIVDELDNKYSAQSFSITIKQNNSFELTEADGKTGTYKLGQRIDKPYGSFTVVPTAASQVMQPSKSRILVQFNNIADVATGLSQSIKIEPITKNTSVINISLIDPIPERGKDVINMLVKLYETESVEDKNIKASNTIAFLDERIKYITSELSGVERNEEQYKRQNEVTDVASQASNYVEQASDYNKQLSEWAIQIDVLESIEEYLNSSANQYKSVPSTLGIQDQTLLGLIAKFNELQLEGERMSRTAQPNNPYIQNINDQLANLKTNILENLRNIKRGLVITSNNLKQSSGKFQSRIRKVPLMERELIEIKRQQAIKQTLYQFLLQKREESALALAATVSNSRVIDPAVSSAYPISPNKQTIYLISLLLGLGVPFAFVFVSNILNNKIQTRQEVEKRTATPILGEISHDSRSAKNAVIVLPDSRSPIVEMFRLIRANLHFAAVGQDNKVILITSSMAGEGKTFFSINLGASLALTGKKVVLLELDLRKPMLSSRLGLTDAAGITNYLTSDAVTMTDIIRPTEKAENLFIISSGPIPPNPAELMMSAKLAHLIHELQDSFDHIIIDSAPIGQVSDAFSLSALVDSTIYLLRYNYTFKKQIEIIDTIYRAKTLNRPMIVLNDAKKENGQSYGYGYGYEETKSQKKKRLAAG